MFMHEVKRIRGKCSSRPSNKGGVIALIPRAILKLFTFGTFMGVAFCHLSLSGTDTFSSPLDLKQVERIDRFIEKRLRTVGVKPNPVASQEVLLRRLYLQIIGRNPTVQEFEDYMGASPSGKSSFADRGPEEKKRELIDRLLQSREYGMSEFNFWSEMKNEPDNSNMKLFYFWAWLKKQLNDDLPFDELVFKMLTETGNVFESDGVAREFRQNGNFANWFADTMLFSMEPTLLAPNAMITHSIITTRGSTTK